MERTMLVSSFSRHDEHRLEYLQRAESERPLTGEEQEELASIEGRYKLFIAEGLSNLRAMAPTSSSQGNDHHYLIRRMINYPSGAARSIKNRLLFSYGLGFVLTVFVVLLRLVFFHSSEEYAVQQSVSWILTIHLYLYMIMSLPIMVTAIRTSADRTQGNVYLCGMLLTGTMTALSCGVISTRDSVTGETVGVWLPAHIIALDLFNCISSVVAFILSRRP